MEELTQEELEQQEQDLREEVTAEVFEGKEPAPEPEVEIPEETDQDEISPALKEMLSNVQGQVSELNTMATRLRKAEGKIGELNSQLIAANEAVKGLKDAPTREEIDAAIQSKKEWEELKEDFPTWAKKFEEMEKKLDQRIEAVGGKLPDPTILEQQIAQNLTLKQKKEMENYVRNGVSIIYNKYPNFREDTRSDDFKNWMASQPYSMQVRKESWNPADALMVMESYYNHKETGSVQARRNKRLAASVTTRRGRTPRVQSETDLSDAQFRDKLARDLWSD
jgi:hypothetical protein